MLTFCLAYLVGRFGNGPFHKDGDHVTHPHGRLIMTSTPLVKSNTSATMGFFYHYYPVLIGILVFKITFWTFYILIRRNKINISRRFVYKTMEEPIISQESNDGLGQPQHNVVHCDVENPAVFYVTGSSTKSP